VLSVHCGPLPQVRNLPQEDSGTVDERWLTMANSNAGAAGGGAIYGLGIFGALVYFWQQADFFWEYLLALLQGLFWPAFMVYEVFAALAS